MEGQVSKHIYQAYTTGGISFETPSRSHESMFLIFLLDAAAMILIISVCSKSNLTRCCLTKHILQSIHVG